MKKFLCILGIIATCGIAIFLLVITEIKCSEKKYNDTLLNIPTKYYIEEDLEIVFISTDVVVLNYEQDEDMITYLIEVEDKQYLVLYQIKRKKGIIYDYYCWEYVSHRLI